jgi:thiamine biosynthesis lipoprotein
MLSATVIAASCAMADAYATAFMVMGLEESMDFINENWDLGLEIYLIYEEDGEIRTAITENLANLAIQP